MKEGVGAKGKQCAGGGRGGWYREARRDKKGQVVTKGKYVQEGKGLGNRNKGLNLG